MTRGGENRAEIFSPIKEATEKAIQNYNEAIFVLEPGNVTATHMQAVSEDEKEDSDWFEF